MTQPYSLGKRVSMSIRDKQGIARSLIMYYGNPLKLRRMRQFYAQFIQPGDLCFDIGAHVGNRTFVWLGLGAHVVAVEPQPACTAILQRWYGNHPDVSLVTEAVGAAVSQQTLWISHRTPTVTTLSQPWMEEVQQSGSFAAVRWEEGLSVPVTTLDLLIERYGLPVFCKIDVEGYELEVLRGLTHPIQAVSFEHIPATSELALDSIRRLSELGAYEYNWSQGEQHRWQSEQWLSAHEMSVTLRDLDANADSGDVYARLLAD